MKRFDGAQSDKPCAQGRLARRGGCQKVERTNANIDAQQGFGDVRCACVSAAVAFRARSKQLMDEIDESASDVSEFITAEHGALDDLAMVRLLLDAHAAVP